MYYSIGKQLGALLAHYEADLHEDPDDIEALQKISLISETYRNFTATEKPGFREDFEVAYQGSLSEIRKAAEASASKPTEFGEGSFKLG